MALFKIFKGNDSTKLSNYSTLPLVEGYAYYDLTTRKFYIDAMYGDATTLSRQPLNAENADKANVAVLSKGAVYAIDKTTETIPNNYPTIQEFYAHSLGIRNNQIYLQNANGQEITDSNAPPVELGTHVTVYRWTSS